MDAATILGTVSQWLWNHVLLYVLLAVGIYFTLRLRLVQVRKLGMGVRTLTAGLRRKSGTERSRGMSPFQALTTAIAAQVGTGNITGCATALAAGGPGAIFWMWVSGFFGMATIYAEAVLAQTYRSVRPDGSVLGGPAYYIRAAVRGRVGRILAGIFSVLLILALGIMGNMVQSNSIADAFQHAFHIPTLAVGIGVAAVSAFVFLGGVGRVASVTEKLVPLMAGIYVAGCAAILVLNRTELPEAVRSIFVGAFRPQAVAGGAAGLTLRETIRYGVARGLFSNEAGLGSTPHAHAQAKVKRPEEQGIVAMLGVFVSTFVILTLTALVLLTTGVLGSGLEGTALAQLAFQRAFGQAGKGFVAICMLLFGFSTVVGWYFFGEQNVEYLFGRRGVLIYTWVVLAALVAGSGLRVDLVWNLADLFNGLMALPNLIALLLLGHVVAGICRAGDGGKRLSGRERKSDSAG